MTRPVKRALAATGLLPAVRRVRRSLWLATDRTIREREREYREGFDRFRQRYAHVLRPDEGPASGAGGAAGIGVKTALVAGSGCPTLEAELSLIVALRLAGCRPVVVLQDHWRMLRPYYELAGVDDVHLWSEYEGAATDEAGRTASALDRCHSIEDVLGITHAGIRAGQAAISTAFRRHRVGSLDWRAPRDRRILGQCLDVSLTLAGQADRMLAAIRPQVALFWDTDYSPTAELFDGCVGRGVDTIAYRTSHQTNGLIFKRYSPANRDEQVSSLSANSWAIAQRMDWSAALHEEVGREIAASYARGDWFKECWTQSQARLIDPAEVRATIGLDPSKKTAVIFSHILWDAPVSWAKPLFATYEDWLVETARAACANDRLNWVIKIHPANVGKGAREGYSGEAAELVALRTRVGPLPPHVVVLPPDTGMNALSVFRVMDYCLTVRGTVGIEAARLGVPVLTAADARYSGRGFTVDSRTPAEYLARLSRIEETPPLAADARELAGRFAYLMFVRRPLVMQSVTWDYGDLGQQPRGHIQLKTADAWQRAPDIQALARWIRDSRDEDFLAASPS
jgi:hypothetical protein